MSDRPIVVLLMGVSGCGKTHVGQLLAERLGWEFLDGDDFHPVENVRKMASGRPLEDADRWPWLEAIRDVIGQRIVDRWPAVIGCSALKESYRGALGIPTANLALVHLVGDPELIRARLRARSGHFMPSTLLASQLDALEPATGALAVDVAQTPEAVAGEIVAALGLEQSG